MKLTEKRASILLMVIISARATSFMFSKLCLTTMNACSLIAVRFTIASLLTFLVFFRRIIRNFDLRDMGKGALFGTLFFCTLMCEHTGLQSTDSGMASFLENMAIILVPLMEAVLRRRFPEKKNMLRAVMAITGVALLSIEGGAFTFTIGELWLLGAALFYALAIICTNRLSGKGDTFNMGFFQISTMAVLGIITVLLRGDLTMPSYTGQWGMILLLAVVCTCFGFTLQPVAQSRISSEKAALYCALSPMVAGILGVIFLQEGMTALTVLGEALILLSLLLR